MKIWLMIRNTLVGLLAFSVFISVMVGLGWAFIYACDHPIYLFGFGALVIVTFVLRCSHDLGEVICARDKDDGV